MSTDSPRLLADAMLGSLARWLRILGVDVAYDRRLDDPGLVERAVREGRILLTRDRRLVERKRARRYLLIRSEDISEQLRQVIEELGLEIDPGNLFGRCLRCNELLEELAPEAAAERVPAYVARTQKRFRQCPSCRRIYWRATHHRRMLERLQAMGLVEGNEGVRA